MEKSSGRKMRRGWMFAASLEVGAESVSRTGGGASPTELSLGAPVAGTSLELQLPSTAVFGAHRTTMITFRWKAFRMRHTTNCSSSSRCYLHCDNSLLVRQTRFAPPVLSSRAFLPCNKVCLQVAVGAPAALNAFCGNGQVRIDRLGQVSQYNLLQVCLIAGFLELRASLTGVSSSAASAKPPYAIVYTCLYMIVFLL